jgi:hypothetical protein
MKKESEIESKESFQKRIPKQKIIETKYINRKAKIIFERKDIEFSDETDYDGKFFTIEQLEISKIKILDEYKNQEKEIREEINKEEKLSEKIDENIYRICYYIVGKIGSRRNKWTWGQYAPFILEKDMANLINEMIKFLPEVEKDKIREKLK